MIVADPNFAPMYATRDKKIKTDKRDARALCEACRLGAYRPAHRTSECQRKIRAQLLVRSTLVRTRSKYISLIGVALQRLVWGKVGRDELCPYAATPKRLSTNFACPAESLPSNLFTCPFLIMCIDSTPSSVRSAV